MRQSLLRKYFTHVHYVCIQWAAGPVRMVLLLMKIIKDADFAIHINCMKDMPCKLKTLIPVLKKFVIPNLEVS